MRLRESGSPFGVIARYRQYLPLKPDTVPATLGEGSTPLIPSRLAERRTGLPGLPQVRGRQSHGVVQGPGHDRGHHQGHRKRARRPSSAPPRATPRPPRPPTPPGRACAACVLIPEGKIAMGKLSQALMHGAVAIAIEGNFDLALEYVKEISGRQPITLVNSLNPYRIEGQKTAAFEIVDTLGEAPDYHFDPGGQRGQHHLLLEGITGSTTSTGWPSGCRVMMGLPGRGRQPPRAWTCRREPRDDRHGHPHRQSCPAEEALAAACDSGGVIRDVTDTEILAAQRLLAQKEGVFCEPASAASVAGLLKYGHTGLPSGDTVVAVLTGHGLKDPQTAIDQSRPSSTARPIWQRWRRS